MLIVNPRSGDGKAERFGLVSECRTRGIEAVLFESEEDLAGLAEAAVSRRLRSDSRMARESASDVILLEKDLDVLADGVVEGRRIFANTMTSGTQRAAWR